MNTDDKRIAWTIREVSPCKGCTERFCACWDHCPKDERGEYGYKAWKAEIKRVNNARVEYAKRNNKRCICYDMEDK